MTCNHFPWAMTFPGWKMILLNSVTSVTENTLFLSYRHYKVPKMVRKLQTRVTKTILYRILQSEVNILVTVHTMSFTRLKN